MNQKQNHKADYLINQAINKLDEWNFIKVIDQGSHYNPGSDLYYKHLHNNDYIIVCHIYKPKKDINILDTWKVLYDEGKTIGKDAPNDIMRLNIDLEHDFESMYKLLRIFDVV